MEQEEDSMKTSLMPLFLVGLVACGSPDATTLTNDSYSALAQGEYQTAFEGFEDVLARADVPDNVRPRAQMGAIEALVHLDAEKARDEFLTYAQANAGIGEKDYRVVGSKLTSARKFHEAIAVLDAGIQRYGQAEALTQTLKAIKLEAADDESVQHELASLGDLN